MRIIIATLLDKLCAEVFPDQSLVSLVHSAQFLVAMGRKNGAVDSIIGFIG